MTAAYWSDGAAGPVLGLFEDLAAEAVRPELAWMDSGICAETDPEAFFVEKGGNPRPAKRVCMACPVRTECAEYAIENDIGWGIWGALSPKQREDIKRGRDRSAA